MEAVAAQATLLIKSPENPVLRGRVPMRFWISSIVLTHLSCFASEILRNFVILSARFRSASNDISC